MNLFTQGYSPQNYLKQVVAFQKSAFGWKASPMRSLPPAAPRETLRKFNELSKQELESITGIGEVTSD